MGLWCRLFKFTLLLCPGTALARTQLLAAAAAAHRTRAAAVTANFGRGRIAPAQSAALFVVGTVAARVELVS